MASILPPIPKAIFCYFEPFTLLLGAVVPVLQPDHFIPSQLPTTHLVASQTSPTGAFNILPTERVLVYQVANLYGLLLLVGLAVLNTTTEPRVVHAYILALWIADIGHVAATGSVMGQEALLGWRDWNSTMWGSIGITSFLFTMRSLYMMGALGSDKVQRKKEKTR